MILPDVNVLIYAHREECERHEEYKGWLEGVLGGSSSFGISDFVLSSCLRILTHPRVFEVPTRRWLRLRSKTRLRMDCDGSRREQISGAEVARTIAGASPSKGAQMR